MKAVRRKSSPYDDVLVGVQSEEIPALPRGLPVREPHQYETPQAMFADPAVVAETLAFDEEKHLFLGVLGGTVARPEGGLPHVEGGAAVGYLDDRHMITIAGTRAGKGRAAIVPNLLTWRGSVLAIDPKGELAKLTAQRRLDLGQAVHVLDPFGVAELPEGMEPAAFNPLADLAEKDVIEAASLIADALVVAGTEQDPHWNESARAFIEGVILHVATHPKYEGERAHLGTVRDKIGHALAPGGEISPLEQEMRDSVYAEGLVELEAANFFDRPERERGSVLSTARRHLKFLDYPGIRSVLSRSDFRLADLKTGAATVYLCLPARHMGSCSRWLRLFINLTLQEMETTRLGGDEAKTATGLPVLLCLDEFATLGHMRQIEDAAGQIAGFGVKLWPILQDLGQLKALYKERWETFMGNAGVLQFFGNNDLTTLEWISKRCGKTTVRVLRENPPGPAQQASTGLSGESWSAELHDLLTPEEAGRFFRREDPLLRQLVLIPGAAPVVLQRAYYDKHELFRPGQGGEP